MGKSTCVGGFYQYVKKKKCKDFVSFSVSHHEATVVGEQLRER